MSYAPFDIRLIVERIKGAAAGFRAVSAVIDVDSIRISADFTTPGAYVLLPSETSGQGINGARTTPADTQFSVAVAMSCFRERRREMVTDEFFTLIANLRAALIGWTPGGIGLTAIKWKSGRVYDSDSSTFIWLDDYQLTKVLQA